MDTQDLNVMDFLGVCIYMVEKIATYTKKINTIHTPMYFLLSGTAVSTSPRLWPVTGGEEDLGEKYLPWSLERNMWIETMSHQPSLTRMH